MALTPRSGSSISAASTWEPGLCAIKVELTLDTGAIASLTFLQEVGVRGKDLAVVGWVDPSGVTLDPAGVNANVLLYFPPSGAPANFLKKLVAVAYLREMAVAGQDHVPLNDGTPLSANDRRYLLNWMFKHAANSRPPSTFADEQSMDGFEAEETNYKLFNRLQTKYLVNGAEFQPQPNIIRQPGQGFPTQIGVTKDPVFGLRVPGKAGPIDNTRGITNNDSAYQINEGSPDSTAVAVFNNLMSPLRWSDIGSNISQGPAYGIYWAVTNQVYPTYFIYQRKSDGSFYLWSTRLQAPEPSQNFFTNPYPYGPAPFLP